MSPDVKIQMTYLLLAGILFPILGIIVLIITRSSKWWVPGLTVFYSSVAILVALLFSFSYAGVSLFHLVLSLLTPIFLVPFLLIACLLYGLRGTSPFFYGLIEIGIGCLAILFALEPNTTGSNAKLISIIGGIYIVVRGMTNMEPALPPKIKSKRNVVFPGRT